jgi:hypothetical protein
MGTRESDQRNLLFAESTFEFYYMLEGNTFFFLEDQKALFSESNQEIYGLNDLAAFIWCRLEERDGLDEICTKLVESGLSPAIAYEYIQEAMRHWLKLGILKLEFGGVQFPTEGSITLNVAGFKISIGFADESLMKLVTPEFAHLRVYAESPDYSLQIIEINKLTHTFHQNRSIFSCPARELVPSIKAHITDRLFEQYPSNVAFHAASLVRGEKCIFISGPPGAGKTTLATRLVEEGFEYCGDDIVLLSPDGTVKGVPFAPTQKQDSWKLISQFRPDLEDLIVHQRPDGLRVRYLPPRRIASIEPHVVGSIIFIRRTSFGPAKLEPLAPAESMARLIKSSYSPEGKLKLASFSVLKKIVANARSFELTYSNLEHAKDELVDLCRA